MTATVPPSAAPPSSLEVYLRARVPACFPGSPAVDRVVELAAGVWELEMAGGKRVVAKLQVIGDAAGGLPDDLLAVEVKVLEALGAAGCPVPAVLGTDPVRRFIFLEHRGRLTADDLCQTADAATRAQLCRRIIDGFEGIEGALGGRPEEILQLVSSAGTRPQLRRRDALASAGARAGLIGLQRVSRRTPADVPHLSELVTAIAERLGSRVPTLGSLDYNARNIVVDERTSRPSFIEFAKVGWDWPERRLVQYATSLGSGRTDFVGLITPDTARLYAARKPGDAGRLFALDGHHMLFHLNASAMLARAFEEPEKAANRALLQVWRRPRHRLRQLVHALATPLSDDPQCTELRGAIGEFASAAQRGA